MLCHLKNAQSTVNTVLVLEGCLGRLALTSLLSQQLLSRAGQVHRPLCASEKKKQAKAQLAHSTLSKHYSQ